MQIFSSLWFNNLIHVLRKGYNTLKQSIQCRCKYVESRWLTKQPSRDIAYAVSHGGTHLLLFIIVAVITGLWWYHQTNSSNEVVHKIGIGFMAAADDTITTLGYDLIIDSDTIRDKTKGEYHSAIRIHYRGTVDTVQSLIQIYAKPFLYNAKVDRESVFRIFDHTVVDTIKILGDTSVRTAYKSIYRDTVIVSKTEWKPVGDSILNIRITPAKNEELPLGGFPMGTQTITVYSNQLGISEQSSTYNYYIGLGLMPHVEDTEHASGYSNISIQIGDMAFGEKTFSTYFNENKNLTYSFVYPEPDILSMGYIYYSSLNKLHGAWNTNHGIIIQCEDLDAKNKNNRKAIIYSVLVGTGVAFLLDILVQLVREWRNVNRRNENHKNDEQKKSETLNKRKDDEDD